MKILHQLLSANSDSLSDCIGQLVAGDNVLLVDAGVALLGRPEAMQRLRAALELTGTGPVLALTADLAARGLLPLAARAGVQAVSDADWYGLVRSVNQVLTWK